MIKESEFKFLGYRISIIQCEIDDKFDTLKSKFSHSINIHQFRDKNNDRFVEIALDIEIKEEENTFHFFMRIKGGFQADNDMPQELFEIMATQNAPAILFPFARAIITTYTAQANIPPIILPSINFARIPQSVKQTAEQDA